MRITRARERRTIEIDDTCLSRSSSPIFDQSNQTRQVDMDIFSARGVLLLCLMNHNQYQAFLSQWSWRFDQQTDSPFQQPFTSALYHQRTDHLPGRWTKMELTEVEHKHLVDWDVRWRTFMPCCSDRMVDCSRGMHSLKTIADAVCCPELWTTDEVTRSDFYFVQKATGLQRTKLPDRTNSSEVQGSIALRWESTR